MYENFDPLNWLLFAKQSPYCFIRVLTFIRFSPKKKKITTVTLTASKLQTRKIKKARDYMMIIVDKE